MRSAMSYYTFGVSTKKGMSILRAGGDNASWCNDRGSERRPTTARRDPAVRICLVNCYTLYNKVNLSSCLHPYFSKCIYSECSAAAVYSVDFLP